MKTPRLKILRIHKPEAELRKNRIRNIYEEVLCKAGQNNAKQLYKQYFPDTFRTIDATELSQKVEEKRRRETSGEMNLICYGPGTKKEIILPAKTKKPPSSVEKRIRIMNYGRWYLRPKEFEGKLNDACGK